MTRRLIGRSKLTTGEIQEIGRIFASYYGDVANMPTTRAVSAAVKRYYAVASAGDGRRACTMLTPRVARGVPTDYGRFGPMYLHTARTCRAVAARLFAHERLELTTPIAVRGVLSRGGRAYALIGSSKMSPSIVALVSWHGKWMLDEPLGGHIPSYR